MKNTYMRDQVLLGLLQSAVFKSMCKRFIRKKNVHYIHDTLSYRSSSNWENYLIMNSVNKTLHIIMGGI